MSDPTNYRLGGRAICNPVDICNLCTRDWQVTDVDTGRTIHLLGSVLQRRLTELCKAGWTVYADESSGAKPYLRTCDVSELLDYTDHTRSAMRLLGGLVLLPPGDGKQGPPAIQLEMVIMCDGNALPIDLDDINAQLQEMAEEGAI
jgi:hypothetical protein